MKFDIVPPLSKTVYGRAAIVRKAVGMAVEYALLHEKGDGTHPRPLRAYFDLLNEKKQSYVDVRDGTILPRDYGPAMRLRREMDLMARHGRLYPKSVDGISAFMTLIPGLIQVLDPSVPDPNYEVGLTATAPLEISADGIYEGRTTATTRIDGVAVAGMPITFHWTDTKTGAVSSIPSISPRSNSNFGIVGVAPNHLTHGCDLRVTWQSPGGLVFSQQIHFFGANETRPDPDPTP